MWNLLNGLNLHKLEPVTNSEVTGVTCLHDNQLLAVGWSQCIAQYDIAAAKVKLNCALNSVISSIRVSCTVAPVTMNKIHLCVTCSAGQEVICQ